MLPLHVFSILLAYKVLLLIASLFPMVIHIANGNSRALKLPTRNTLTLSCCLLPKNVL